MPAKFYYEYPYPEDLTAIDLYHNVARPLLENKLTVNELHLLDELFTTSFDYCECDFCDHCGQPMP